MKNIITKKEQLRHNIARILLVLALMAVPVMTFAQTQADNTLYSNNPIGTTGSTQTKSLSDLVILAIKYFNIAIIAIVGLAVLMFVWNIFRYFFKSDVADKKEAGLYVMYSVIGFFIIISFWGLVTILTNTFALNTAAPSIQVFGTSINSSSLFSGGGTSNSALPSNNAN